MPLQNRWWFWSAVTGIASIILILTLIAVALAIVAVRSRNQAQQERRALQWISQKLTGPLSVREIAISAADESKRIFRHDVFSLNVIDTAHEKFQNVYKEETPPGGSAPVEISVSLKEDFPNPADSYRRILAGGVAHDFNNLLVAIMGYSEMALQEIEPDSSLRKKIEEVIKAGTRAKSLTQQLLAFSRKQVIQPEVLNLNAVVTEMFSLLERLLGEDIEIRFDLDHSLGCVKVDRGQIEQVVVNLSVNARDTMTQGGLPSFLHGTLNCEPVRNVGKPESFPANTFFSASAIPAEGWMNRSSSIYLNRFSQPKKKTKAPALDYRPSIASSDRTAEVSL